MKHRRPLVTLVVAVLWFFGFLLANMIVHPAESATHAAGPVSTAVAGWIDGGGQR